MAKLVYGVYRYTVNENGIDVPKEELRHVDEVERGLACNCFCSDHECNGRLVGRQGEINEHHFAHHNLDECEYGYRIGILKQAEMILKASKHIMVPIVEPDGEMLNFVDTGKAFRLEYTDIDILESCIKIHKRGVHSTFAISRGNIRLFVELRFTKVNKDIVDNYKKNKRSAMVIHLDDLKNDSPEGLKNVLINGIENKAWIYNRKKEEKLEEKRKEREQQIAVKNSSKNMPVDVSRYQDIGKLIFQQQKERKEKLFLDS